MPSPLAKNATGVASSPQRGVTSTRWLYVKILLGYVYCVLTALEDKTAKVGIISQHPYLFRASKDQGIAPYLQLSLLTDLNHTG